MVKVQVLTRSMDTHLPVSAKAPAPQFTNLDPLMHPFQKARSYNRALTAAKLDRMFAKPFIGALESPGDGVYCLAKDYEHLGRVASGSADGMVAVWDLPTRQLVGGGRGWDTAHKGMVKGVCFSGPGRAPAPGWDGTETKKRGKKRKRPQFDSDKGKGKGKGKAAANNGESDEEMEDEEESGAQPEHRGSERLLSCGVDKTVKLWDIDAGPSAKPLQVFHGKIGFQSISHHRSEGVFATASDRIHIWDETKTDPIQTLNWSTATTFTTGDHVTCVSFNQSESSVLASSGSDRTVALYDLRSGRALGRVAMSMRTNQISFNPMQPMTMLFASEDHQLHSFDMRNLKRSTQVYKDHIGAVISCDWSPNGREFVSGSYDKTVRLWNQNEGKSKDCYHTKRMQRVFDSLYTLDSQFVLSGSDDGNVRIWKSRASRKLGVLDGAEKEALEYREKLREKWQHVGEVGKIERQRYLPKSIYNTQKLRRTMLDSRMKKEENRRAHAKGGRQVGEQIRSKPERMRAIERVDV